MAIAVIASLALATAGRNEDYRSAVSIWQKVIEVEPGNHKGYNNLGNALQLQGKAGEAVSCYFRSLEIEPNSALSHTNLGNAFQSQGKPDEAISRYRQALGIEPDYAPALNNLSWLLATYPEARIRNASQAIGFAERAAELTKYEDDGVLDTLAAAHAERGDFEKAVKYVKEAIKIARGRTATSVIMEYEEHLAAYKANKPWRQ